MTTHTTKTATIGLFTALVVVGFIMLSTASYGDPTPNSEQTRLAKKIADIDNNERLFQNLSEKAHKLESEIAYIEHLIQEDGVSELQKNTYLTRIAQLQENLSPTYEEMNRVQEIHYRLYEIPTEKISKLDAVYDSLKQEFDKRGDTTPLVDLYINYRTEEVSLISKHSDLGLTDSDKAMIKEKAGDTDYTIEHLAETKRHKCAARSTNCDPMFGGLKVKVSTNSGKIGTLGFPATRNGDAGFVITSHQAGDVTGGIVYQNTKRAGIVEDVQNWHCDCAFVDQDGTRTTSDKIWISTYGRFTITDEADQADHSVGTLLRKSGITTGVTTGTIYGQLGNYIKTTVHTNYGDSGAPVYAGSGNSGMLYGLLFAKLDGTNNGIYTPYHTVKSYLELE